MASVTALPGPQPEHRGLAHWMDRVVKELEHVRKEPATDAVHDLRVAIRRCRSVSAVLQEVDPDPAWHEMRSVPKKLFRKLGELRDAQVMDEWVKTLAADGNPIRAQLQAAFAANKPELRQRVLRAAEKFEEKSWSRVKSKLCKRVRVVPVGGLAAQCLAVERLEEARELHTAAQRTDKPKPWHHLRIGLKRLRYTVESLLPEQYTIWSDNLKRLQDLLGEVHDLDVLAEIVQQTADPAALDSLNKWEETVRRERSQRIETYRQLTLGRTSIWNDWRQGLPQGNRLALASMARIRATARAADSHPRRSAQTSRIAAAVFDALKRAHAAPAFGERTMRRVLRAASCLQRVAAPRHEWELVAWTVRYHRGVEPTAERGAFAKLSEDEQKNVRALAGVLRVARALRKCGVDSCEGMHAEKSLEAIVLHVPGLIDSVENAARLAAAKHFLETYLGKALILKPVPKAEERVVELLAQFREHQRLPAACAASD
jgi:CHAD domain-containing protein